MIDIKNLQVSIEEKEIIKNLNLQINSGEVHAIMGPNGSGKSTLSYALSGQDGYEAKGEINYNGENILDLNTEERAQKGIFLAFQYPIEIPGVFTNNFLRTSINAVKKSKGEKEINAVEFLNLVKEKSQKLKIDKEKELEKRISGETNEQLKRFSLIYFNKIKKDTKIYEL